MASKRAETLQNERMIDAIRECLDMRPLYGDPARRDARRFRKRMYGTTESASPGDQEQSSFQPPAPRFKPRV